MCMFKGGGGGTVQTAAPAAAPTKSSAEVQATSEQERVRLAASTTGFASTILTGGFGSTVMPKIKGVAVGT